MDRLFEACAQIAVLGVWVTARPPFHANPPTNERMHIITPNVYTKHGQVRIFELTAPLLAGVVEASGCGFTGRGGVRGAAGAVDFLAVVDRLLDCALRLTTRTDSASYYASADFA
jgi:hypothetical protein